MKNLKKALGLCLLTLLVSKSPLGAETKPQIVPPQPQMPAAANAPAMDPTTVVATVDGKNITFKELDEEISKRPGMLQQINPSMQQDPNFLKQMRSSVLNNLIDRQLLLTAAQKGSTPPDQAAIEAQAQAIYAQAGGQAGFEKQLTAMGITAAEFRQELGENMAISKYLEENTKSVTPSDEEIKAYFEKNKERFAEQPQVRARHILLKVADKTKTEESAATKKKMEDIRKEATAPGADFGALAMKYSQCPSAPKGGDLGFFKKGQMVPPFENAAFTLKPGDISDIVETQFGYHIIKVEEKKDGGPADLEKSKDRIAKMLENQRRSEAVQAKITELRSSSKVEVKL